MNCVFCTEFIVQSSIYYSLYNHPFDLGIYLLQKYNLLLLFAALFIVKGIFVTNSNFLMLISCQPKGVDLLYFKLRSLELT